MMTTEILKIVHIEKDDITIELLLDCYHIVARIVERYGDTYLPIFIRLHKEIENRKEHDRMMGYALAMAKKHHTDNDIG